MEGAPPSLIRNISNNLPKKGIAQMLASKIALSQSLCLMEAIVARTSYPKGEGVVDFNRKLHYLIIIILLYYRALLQDKIETKINRN